MGAGQGFVKLFFIAVIVYLVYVMYKGGGLKGLQNLMQSKPVTQPVTPPVAATTCPAGQTGTPPNCKAAVTPPAKTNGNGGGGNGGNGNGGGNGGNGGGGEEDEDEGPPSPIAKKNGAPKAGTGPSCTCPKKPDCDQFCNSPAFFNSCCDTAAKRARTVYNAHMIAYVANTINA